MKKTLFLIFVWISCNTLFAQKSTPNNTQDSKPNTSQGISLPQLITTNINRSNLQFGINLSEGLKQPNLSVRYEKFISDEKKQLRINIGARVNHTFSFNGNENSDFYTINDMSINYGADLKLFNEQNYFLQLATQNSLGKFGGLTDFDNPSTSNTLTIGFGKGRIDYVDDGTAALMITDKLSKYGVLNRDLTEDEYYRLVQKINDLKNRRRFVNRSYPLSEIEEIHEFLMTIGAINEEDDVTAIIDNAYRYEPMVERTTGSQFRASATGSYYRSSFFNTLNIKGISGSISYMNHSPINMQWQYNKGIEGYFSVSEATLENTTISYPNEEIRRAGIGLINNLHYLISNKASLSFLSTLGYNFVNRINIFSPTIDNDEFYLNTSAQLEHQITRTMSTTLGIQLNMSQEYVSTGLILGLTF